MTQCVRVSGIGVDGTLIGNVTFNPDTYYITINDNTGYFESSLLDFTGRFTLSFTFTNMAATTDTAIIFESSFLKLSLENGVIKIYKNGTKVGNDITPYLGYNTFKIDGYTSPNDIIIMFGRTSATDTVHTGSLTPPSTPETVKFLQGYSGTSLATATLTRPTSWAWISPYEGYRGIKGETSTLLLPNYSVVGSPTISSKYIASGFSVNDYLTQDLFNINYHQFEIVFKVYGYSTSHTNPLCSKNNSQNWLSKIQVDTDGKVTVLLSNNNSSWNVCHFTTSGAIPNDTWLLLKIKFDGTAYVVSYSTDKETWTELGRATTGNYYGQNLSKLFSSNDTGSSGLKNGYGGQVDLKECYLSIDDMKAWQGAVIVNQQKYSCWGNGSILFENSTPGTYTVNIPFTGNYEVTCVGAGGPAAMRGVYDDKGYGWGGGSGGAFKGVFTLAAGSYTVVVGSANNNTTAQSGNTQTLNPSDTTTHDSSIDGVVVCGGGGAGHYNTDYVGAAGAAPVLSLVPVSTVLNTAGNAGRYNSGGKGSAAAATCAGGTSVYLDYGRGQGCKTSEYAAKRSWINGTNGYVRIRSVI